MSTKNFTPAKTIILLNDTYLVNGKGRDNFLTITEKMPQYEMITDIDGINKFIKTKDGSAEIKLNLMENSEAIDFINEYILQISNGQVSGLSISIVDLNKPDSPKVYIGIDCKINMTDISKGVKLGEKQYTLLPAEYYNEWKTASQVTSQALNDAIFSMINNKLKVKGT